MNTTTIPPRLKELLGKLSFYNSCGPGQKICFGTKTTVPANSIIWGPISRWISGDSREKLLEETNKLIQEASDGLKNAEWRSFRYLIFYELEEMLAAITRQLNVYVGTQTEKDLKLSIVDINALLSMISDLEREQALDHRSLMNSAGYTSGSPNNLTSNVSKKRD